MAAQRRELEQRRRPERRDEKEPGGECVIVLDSREEEGK